jgi:hypothetical protein
VIDGYFVTVLFGARELMLYRGENGFYYSAPKRLLPSRAFASMADAKKAVKSAAMRDLLNAAALGSTDVEIAIRKSGGLPEWRKLYTDKPLKALVYEIESAE